MERRKSRFVISCLILACFLSIALFQGNVGQKVENTLGNTNRIHVSQIYPCGVPSISAVGLSGVLKAGNSLTITWYIENIQEDPYQDINYTNVYAIGSNINITIAKNVAVIDNGYGIDASSSVVWIIPTSITPGSYYIEVQDGNSPGNFASSTNITISGESSSIPGFPVEFTVLGLAIGVLGMVAIALKKRQMLV